MEVYSPAITSRSRRALRVHVKLIESKDSFTCYIKGFSRYIVIQRLDNLINRDHISMRFHETSLVIIYVYVYFRSILLLLLLYKENFAKSDP